MIDHHISTDNARKRGITVFNKNSQHTLLDLVDLNLQERPEDG